MNNRKTNRKEIWLFAEVTANGIHPAYYELLQKAREIADNLGNDTKICAVILGIESAANLAGLEASGVDIVYTLSHQKLKTYHPDYFCLAFEALARAYQPEIILIPATAIGAELAPTLAAKLKTGLAAHCVDIYLNDDKELVQIVPAFGGEVLGEILTPDTRPVMTTIKPGVFPVVKLPVKEQVMITEFNCDFLDKVSSAITLMRSVPKETHTASLERAELVICGGLGLENESNWHKLSEFAKLTGGSLGYTRPVADHHWVANEDNMIGTSGKTVRPKLYVGFGVSGASHHACGMKDSSLIMNVNINDSTDSFTMSDYQVVASCSSLLDTLLEQLKK